MPGDPYLSWEQLLEEERVAEAEAAAGDGHRAPGPPAAPELPPELEQLLADKERLERELMQLTGEAEPDAEQDRMQRMFPVKVHTRETRLEERRLRQRDELLRLQQQRLLEQQRIAAGLALRREQRQAQLRQQALDEQRLRERWARERQEALLQASRSRAQEAAWQARRQRLEAFRAEPEWAQVGNETRATTHHVSASIGIEEQQREAVRERSRARKEEQRAFEDARERQRHSALDHAAQRRDTLQSLQGERRHAAPRTRASASNRQSPRHTKV
jgi:hypothetical protein